MWPSASTAAPARSQGNYISNNYVAVQNNAKVQVNGDVVLGLITPTAGLAGLSGMGSNNLNVLGGLMTVNGKVDARYGVVDLSGGQLTVGTLVLTNGAANSALNFSGGKLSAQNILHTGAGAAQVIGDGTGATATLNLLNGSTAKFANSVVLTNDAILDIGSSVGTANIDGELTFKSGATWNLDWTADQVGDALNVTGAVALAGTLNVKLDFTPVLFDKLTNLVVFGGASIGGTFDTVQVDGTSTGSLTNGNWQIVFNKAASDSVGYLEVVPEPSALTLVGFALGLTALILRRRR
jgi:subtilase-type serine protease